MDKKTKNLDPKLKAAYDRVMGTNVSPPSPSQAAPQPTKAAQSTQEATPIPTPADSGETKIVAGGSKKSSISPILVTIAIVLFLLIYTFIWFMIFGLKIPFLSS